MELERGASRIFRCPFCGVEAPHEVRARRGQVCVARCAHCGENTLVRSEELHGYQVRWETELRLILERLNGADPRPDGGYLH